MRTIAFHVASIELALPVAQLRELVEPPPVTRVPGAPAALRGVTNLRGQVVPVLDVAVRLGLGASPRSARECLLVTDPASCGVACALAVDGVRGVEDVDPGDARPPPALLAPADWLEAIVVRGERLILLVNLERLLDVEAIQASRSLPAADLAALRAAAGARRQDAAAATAVAMDRELPTETGAAPATPDRPPAPAAAGARFAGADARRHEPWHAVARSTPPALPRPSGAPMPRTVPVRADRAPGDARDRGAAVVGLAGDTARAAGMSSPAPEPRTGEPARKPIAAPASPRAPDRSRGGRVLLAALAAGVALVLLFALVRRSGAEVRPAGGGAPPSVVAPLRFAAEPAAAPVREAPPPAPRLEPVRSEAPALHAATAKMALPVTAEPPRPAAPPRPAKLAPLRPGDVYEVVPGDTLWSISARMLFDPHRWPRLYDANRKQVVDPDLILPGQRFVVPDPASL